MARRRCVSIHAPGEGSDLRLLSRPSSLCQFQSTLPVKGATLSDVTLTAPAAFQSTLPVKGATLWLR